MCWDERTSWTTFAVGSAFNLAMMGYFLRSPSETVRRWVIPLFLLWEFVLLMQVFDALGWRDPESKVAVNGAMLANLLQPVAVFLVLVWASDVEMYRKQIALVLVLVYIFMVIMQISPDRYTSIRPRHGCRNINYAWWEDIKGGGIVYLIAILGSVVLLIQNKLISIAQASFIAVGFIVSLLFYNCGLASVWCWVAAFAPLLNCVVFRLVENQRFRKSFS